MRSDLMAPLAVAFAGKVQALGRVAIPKDVRGVLSIQEGDTVEVEIRKIVRADRGVILDKELLKVLDDIRIELGRLGIHFASRNQTKADIRKYGETLDKLAGLISEHQSSAGDEDVS